MEARRRRRAELLISSPPKDYSAVQSPRTLQGLSPESNLRGSELGKGDPHTCAAANASPDVTSESLLHALGGLGGET